MVFFKRILTFLFFANLTLVLNSTKAQVGLEDIEKAFNKSQGVTNNKVDKLYDNLQDNEYNQTHENLKPLKQPITSVENKYDCDSNNLSQEQIVECEYKIEQKEAELRQKKVEQSQMKKWSLEEARKNNEGDWTKGYSIEEEERKEEERNTQAKKRATELKKVEKRSGLNMFDEESAELTMNCWDSHQGNWLTFEKVDSTIWRRVNNGPRTLPAKILESDDNAKKYYAPISTIIGEIDVVLDFKKKIYQQKNDITGVERISCM